jgi:hypothetical protein
VLGRHLTASINPIRAHLEGGGTKPLRVSYQCNETLYSTQLTRNFRAASQFLTVSVVAARSDFCKYLFDRKNKLVAYMLLSNEPGALLDEPA